MSLNEQIPYIKKWVYKNPGYTNLKYFYIHCTIMPSILILSIFSRDIFYFHPIKYLYYVIPLAMLPLLHAYFKYSLNIVKESYIMELEKRYTGVFLRDSTWLEYEYDDKLMTVVCLWTPENSTKYHETTMSIRDYISFNLQLTIQNDVTDTDIEYLVRPQTKKEFYEQYVKENNIIDDSQIALQDADIIHSYFHIIMPLVLDLDDFLHYSSLFTEQEEIYKKIKTFIIGIYLISWMYIVFISFHKVQYWSITLTILKLWIYYGSLIEPFFDTLL